MYFPCKYLPMCASSMYYVSMYLPCTMYTYMCRKYLPMCASSMYLQPLWYTHVFTWMMRTV